MDKSLLSANFKKDYVAYSAVGIFFLILAFELFLAVFIPLHLEMQDVWSEEVARQEMINRFDYLHRLFLRFRSKRDSAQNEAGIVINSLTPLADYLRQYQYQLRPEQIKEINETLGSLEGLYNHLMHQGAYSTDLKLKPEKFINRLKKEMAKTD
ncbi:MAG: hypothetical protein PHH77_08860 [Victivallaceae bacterium]|nr:hypothetical protein [Victivallaceae bacterium]